MKPEPFKKDDGFWDVREAPLILGRCCFCGHRLNPKALTACLEGVGYFHPDCAKRGTLVENP